MLVKLSPDLSTDVRLHASTAWFVFASVLTYKNTPEIIVPIAIGYFRPSHVSTTHPAKIGPGTVQAAV